MRAIQQAKNPTREPQFLQIVAKPAQVEAARAKLTRVAFKVSRLMEFCSERELENQTGHSVYEWPLVVAKELIDNALDACEEAEVAPEIAVTVEKDTIVVQDNARRHRRRDHRVGARLHHPGVVAARPMSAPTRGAQGNALKTILAMGYVLDRGSGGDRAGVTIIEARGVEHRIEFRVDHINNQPKIVHTTAPSPVVVGTRFTIHWPRDERLARIRGATQFQRARSAPMSWFNPHLTLRGTWFGQEFINVQATNPDWEKWRPRNPTSRPLV